MKFFSPDEAEALASNSSNSLIYPPNSSSCLFDTSRCHSSRSRSSFALVSEYKLGNQEESLFNLSHSYS